MMSSIGPNTPSEKSFIELLLSEYEDLFSKKDLPLSDNLEYMKLTELRFLLKNVRELADIQLYQAYAKAEVFTFSPGASDLEMENIKKTVSDRQRLFDRIQYIDKVINNLLEFVSHRLNIAREIGAPIPRVVQLCEKYRLTRNENDIFHLMNVTQGSNNAHVLNCLIEEDYLRRVTGFQRISGMSEIDIDVFCDGERQHMKEGLVLVDEDNGTQFNLRIQRVAVQLIYGRKVKSDDLLKISQTSLEDILSKEKSVIEAGSVSATPHKSNNNVLKRKRSVQQPQKPIPQHLVEVLKNPDVIRIIKLINNKGSPEDITRLISSLSPEDREQLLDVVQNGKIELAAAPTESESELVDGEDDDEDEEGSDMDYEDDELAESAEGGSAEGSDVEDVPMPSSPVATTTTTAPSSLSTSPPSKKNRPDVDLHIGIPLIRSNSITSSHGGRVSQKVLVASKTSPRAVAAKKAFPAPEGEHSKGSKGSSVSPPMDAVDDPDMVAATLFKLNNSVTASPASHHVNKPMDSIHSLLDNDHLVIADENESTLKPYLMDNQLEYLEDSFQLIALMIKGNVARLKDDMKKEGTSRFSNTWGDNTGDVKHSKRELAAKLKLHESRVQMRLKKTLECGHSLPRLEVMTSRFQLDNFERRIILLLIGKTVSPIVKTLMDTLDTSTRNTAEDVLTVGQALSILCTDFNSQISHRKYFYQSSKLLKNAVISLSRSRWHVGTGDLTENRIILDRRILDWVVGLDSEINELVEGSDLYEPCVNLTQVVLPKGYVDAILSQCVSYDDFQRYRLTSGLEKTLSYGNSLVILLCGKSGTGKTMTVNAIANELHKKVLLVDFNSLINKKDNGNDLEVDLKGLFRESKMSNAVLFFDECEVIFKSRNLGGDRLLNSLLTEIERHEGIVFMATNRPYEIDEAMHRRITMVLEYKEPDYDMRQRIWDNLLGIAQQASALKVDAKPHVDKSKALIKGENDLEDDDVMKVGEEGKEAIQKGLKLAADVDTSVLAIKYELTGGFIKNAVLSSLLRALSRDKYNPEICQSDLIEGCKLQMRGNLTQRNFEDRVSVQIALSRIHLTKAQKDIVQKIVRHEQSRAKVYGSWNSESPKTAIDSNSDNNISGNSSTSGETNGVAVSLKPHTIPSKCDQRAGIHLLAGTRGSGKNTLVKAIANELGNKKMKYIHVADFCSSNISEITLIFKTLCQDARLMDAMIIIDGFEHVMDDSSADSGGGSNTKMHLILSRIMDILFQYHGCVFLLCHIENPQNIMLQRDFASRLLTFMRFTIPPHEIRSLLWQSLLPTNAPLSSDINYETLGRRFEINAGSIRSAIANATSEVAMRTKDVVIHHNDLLVAGDYEVSKLKGGNFELMSKLFS